MSTNNDVKIIVAMDYSDAKSAVTLAEQLNPEKCHLKIGKELFTSADNYIISLNEEPTPADAVLLLAAGLAVDTVYKER